MWNSGKQVIMKALSERTDKEIIYAVSDGQIIQPPITTLGQVESERSRLYLSHVFLTIAKTVVISKCLLLVP
jgi:hypothetical protein